MDEAQFEMSKGLAQYKRFKEKEELKNFLQENPEWCTVNTPKGWFAATSRLQIISQKAVEITTKQYKLNVNLAIDPVYGDTWATCH